MCNISPRHCVQVQTVGQVDFVRAGAWQTKKRAVERTERKQKEGDREAEEISLSLYDILFKLMILPGINKYTYHNTVPPSLSSCMCLLVEVVRVVGLVVLWRHGDGCFQVGRGHH